MTIKTFVFNHYQLNTYLVYDESSKEGIIIDAGNSSKEEDEFLFSFISENGINIKGLYYTHAHVDHIAGNNAIIEKYNIKSYAHKDSLEFFEQYDGYASTLGFRNTKPILPENFLEEGDIISIGDSKLKVIETHGHANGSLSFYSEESQFIIVGDVLFRGSIGRTDLPTGDFDLLSKNIVEKLYSLPNAVKVYSGHGPSTTIGFEKMNNPFVNMGPDSL
jgi:glyoxylase-like metal-dependent hydrolase (beta-lactamase superfamily II)